MRSNPSLPTCLTALAALCAFGAEVTATPASTALVRVVLPLPANVRLADDPQATTVALWLAAEPARSVAPPSTAKPLDALETAGKATYERFCTSCHDGRPAAANIFVQTPRPAGPFFAGLPSAGLPVREYRVTLPDGSVRSVVTSDPGRGLITGDIGDFGRFDAPALAGIRHTAPYFHDHSAKTLEDAVAHHQAFFGLLQSVGETRFAPIPDEQIPGLLAFLRLL